MTVMVLLIVLALLGLTLGSHVTSSYSRWTADQGVKWQVSKGYQAGVNFVPSNAVNELEMFQKETYDGVTIDRELSFAQTMGFNTLRVFLHNILWDLGSDDFLNRLDNFLSIASKRGFSTMFVLLDSCWNAYPKAGTQPEPIPGVHNSQWVQCPGYDIIHNTSAFNNLKPYIQGVIMRFKDDNRVLAWDIWNEPNNSGYADSLISPLIQTAFDWAREVGPTQPLTTPVWQNVEGAIYTPFQKLQLDLSDVISFCTEYMARTEGSTFQPNLEVLKNANVYAYNWGFVSGKTQTIYPWSTCTVPATEEPKVWFHDVLRSDGTAFNQTEISYIQSVLLK
jgi:hypothetical protein